MNESQTFECEGYRIVKNLIRQDDLNLLTNLVTFTLEMADTFNERLAELKAQPMSHHKLNFAENQ